MRPLPQRLKNPRCCPICFSLWLFDTDELGRVQHRHPAKKCVAPTYITEEAPVFTPDSRSCAVCGDPFVGRGNKKTCSDPCRIARQARQKEEIKARDQAIKRRIARLWRAAA